MTRNALRRLPPPAAILMVLGLAAGTCTAVPATATPIASGAIVNLFGQTDNGAKLSARFQPSDVGPDSAGHLIAQGMLTGTLVDPTGAGHPVNQQVTLPAQHAAGTDGCEDGDLVLAPVTLNLLGYRMHLESSHLQTRSDIPRSCTAERLAV